MENEKTIIKSSIKIEIVEKVFNSEGYITDVREGRAKLERTEEDDRQARIDEDSLTVRVGCGCHKFSADGYSNSTPIKQSN
jgi:hypothetical protein